MKRSTGKKGSKPKKEKQDSKQDLIYANYLIEDITAYESLLPKNENEPLSDEKIIKIIEAVKKIKRFIEGRKGKLNLPLMCPNSTILSHLYNASLAVEVWARAVMGRREGATLEKIEMYPLNEEQLRVFNLSWNNSLDSQRFCSVDAAEAIEQEEWKAFFRSEFDTLPRSSVTTTAPESKSHLSKSDDDKTIY